MRFTGTKWLAILGACASMGLAACGSGGGDDDGAATATVAADTVRTAETVPVQNVQSFGSPSAAPSKATASAPTAPAENVTPVTK